MERYKTEILSVEDFLEERPDMEVHTDKTIQSAIYQVAGMLNAKTGGLIQKVWDYSVVDKTNDGSDNGFTQPDPNCVYFRTPEQLAFIKQAFVEQTQYNINLGNDYTQGGGSYSMGNVNASFSRPESRDIFAPMVEYLLQQAKVLDLQSFLVEKTTTSTSDNCIPELEHDTKCLTENYANLTYLKIYQPDADEGRVATINNAHIITFEPLQNVLDAAGGLKAKEIWDPLEQIYKQINEFSVEYFGGLTSQQIYDLIYASGIVWNANIPYQKDWVVLFQLDDGTGNYKYAKSLINNNLGNNPNNSPEQWEILPIERAELQVIFDYIDSKFNELPQINYISEANGEEIFFNNQQDFETFKTTMGVDDTYFQDVSENFVITNQVNTFTSTQRFDRVVELGQVSGTQAYIIPRNDNGKTTLRIGNSPSNNNKRFDIDLENRSNIINVPNPTNNGDVANKQYVDNSVSNFNNSISQLNTKIATNTNSINTLSNKVDGVRSEILQNRENIASLTTKVNDFVSDIYEITLDNMFVSYYKKIYSASGGNVGGVNGAFYTIYTNQYIEDEWEYKIKTLGDIGKQSGSISYASLQISSYINSDNLLVICLNNIYDSNDAFDYWKANIKVIIWRKRVN